MKNKKIRACVACACAAAIGSLGVYTLWSNVSVQLTSFEIKSGNIPAAFNGFRIVHVSDLHNTDYGNKNEKLLQLIRDAKPDMIAITGDLLDSRSTNISTALDFVCKAVELAPVYYVPGNHESRVQESVFAEFEQKLKESGAVYLRNEAVIFERDGQTIHIAGIDDPFFRDDIYMTAQEIRAVYPDNGFKLLLSHRPEQFCEYSAAQVDLALCGHAHGGQFRIPFVGGVFSPHQGLFPEYDAGVFTQGSTNMVVSRGLGNSVLPLRINNRPELVCVELIKE